MDVGDFWEEKTIEGIFDVLESKLKIWLDLSKLCWINVMNFRAPNFFWFGRLVGMSPDDKLFLLFVFHVFFCVLIHNFYSFLPHSLSKYVI